ncbi:RICIN domain-containing protein [Streptomyces coeruleoprunus]|uniref:RICIN domain-containing protein n=1 Tax=Streptomyces coeruleoprunus TaxID=285563 RepID=A0ABV9XCS6_9ACTN
MNQPWDPEATEVLPPAVPPVEATRPLPRIDDGPVYPAPGPGRFDDGPAPGRTPRSRRSSSRTGGRSRVPVVVGAIAGCAGVGLAIGAVLAGDEGGGTGAEATAAVSAAPSPVGSASATATPPDAATGTPSPSPATVVPPAGQPFVLVSAVTGRAADVSGVSVDDGAPLIAWDVHGNPNQRWLFTDTGDGHVEVKAVHSGKCLQAGGPPGPDVAVVQATCTGTDGQRWQLTVEGDRHTLALKGTGLVLGIGPGDGNGGAEPLQVQTPDAARPQVWRLQP